MALKSVWGTSCHRHDCVSLLQICTEAVKTEQSFTIFRSNHWRSTAGICPSPLPPPSSPHRPDCVAIQSQETVRPLELPCCEETHCMLGSRPWPSLNIQHWPFLHPRRSNICLSQNEHTGMIFILLLLRIIIIVIITIPLLLKIPEHATEIFFMTQVSLQFTLSVCAVWSFHITLMNTEPLAFQTNAGL